MRAPLKAALDELYSLFKDDDDDDDDDYSRLTVKDCGVRKWGWPTGGRILL